MRKFKITLILLMPMLLLFSQNAVAGGWHDKLHAWTLSLPAWAQCFIGWLHIFLGLG